MYSKIYLFSMDMNCDCIVMVDYNDIFFLYDKIASDVQYVDLIFQMFRHPIVALSR